MDAAVIDRPPPTGEGLTFEKVWAMSQETDRKLQETARIVHENAELQKETDRQMKESMKETKRVIKKLSKQMGDLHGSFGEMAEHLVAPAIHQRFNELGYHFTGVAPGGYVVRDDAGKVLTQIDILLINDDYIMAVEVKARVHLKDIEHHIKRLEILRKYWNKQHHDTRTIQGAIAGAIFGNVEKKAVINAGFFVLEQSGDTMKIEIPDGFVPREF